MRWLVQGAHLCAWAACYGSLTYTYFRLNGQMLRFTPTVGEYESFAAATSPGLERWMAGSLGVAAVTGVTLAAWSMPAVSDARWWWLMAVKGTSLAALAFQLVWMRRVMWPRRQRAAGGASAAEQRRFYRFTFAMGFFLLVQLVAGTLAHVSGQR
jgi:hypothetical protein